MSAPAAESGAGGGQGAAAERGSGGRGGGRGRGFGGKSKGPPRQKEDTKAQWTPCTVLGRLVKDGKIDSLENIFLYSMPIKEAQIVDSFINADDMKDEIMRIGTVQKVSSAGQRTRFKVHSCIGDGKGHVGVGARTGKEVATAIRAALTAAKLNIVPIRRGYWGNRIGAPHTVPMKVTGKSGSVSVRLIPAPKGTGIVASPMTTKIIKMAGIDDVYTASCGKTLLVATSSWLPSMLSARPTAS